MKLALALGALAALVLVIVASAPTVEASSQASTCSAVSANNAGSLRTWTVSSTGATTCTGHVLAEIHAGESITLTCKEATSGVAPPGVPNANGLTIRAHGDADNYQSNSGTSLWTWTLSTCTDSPTRVAYCTSDGTISGSPRYGLVRLQIRAVRSDVVTYDVNSDTNGASGIIRCNPRLATLTDGNPTSSPSEYVGRDTYRTTMTADAAAYNAGNTVRLDLTCSPNTNTVASAQLGTTTTTLDQALSSISSYPGGCTIVQKVVITKKSSLADISTTDYATWNTGTAPSGVTFSGQTASRTTKELDRVKTVPLHVWKGAFCTGTEGAVGFIGDVMAFQEGAVTNARGETDSGHTLTVTRSYTHPTAGFTLGDDSATTTTGTTACHQKSPALYADTGWQFCAIATDAFGDSGTTCRSLTFLSTYTSPYVVEIIGQPPYAIPGSTINFQLRTWKEDTAGARSSFAPDAALYYYADYLDATGTWQVLLPRTQTTATGLTPNSYHAPVTIPGSWPPGRPVTIFAEAKLAGLYITERTELSVEAATAAGDPLTARANDATLSGLWNVSIGAKWDNGTARTGAAQNISVTVVNQDTGAVLVDRQHPTELVLPGGIALGYYWINGSASVLGNYTILVNATTAQNEIRNAPASTFRVTLPGFLPTDVPHGTDWSPVFERIDEVQDDVGELATRTGVFQTSATETGQESLTRFDALQSGLLVAAGVVILVLLIIVARTRTSAPPRRPGGR